MKMSPVFAIGFLFVQSALAHDLCVFPGIPGCYSKIQEAVDVASPGDKILVYPHPSSKGYRENVVINTPELTLVGRFAEGGPEFMKHLPPETRQAAEDWRRQHPDPDQSNDPKGNRADSCPRQIVDGCETPANPTSCGAEDGFTINAPGVKIKNFTLRHFSDAITLNNADRARVDGVCIFDSSSGVEGTGDLITVSDSRFLGIRLDQGINVTGLRNAALRNALINTDGLRMTGQSSFAGDNFVSLTNDSSCIRIDGADAAITGNYLQACERAGLEYDGDGGKILLNSLLITGDFDVGIDVSGKGLEIGYNKIEQVSADGILLVGDSGSVHHNTVKGSAFGNNQGIQISGNDNWIAHNVTTHNNQTGIENAAGDRNRYEFNYSAHNGRAGIRIANGNDNSIVSNETYRNHGEGINNRGNNTLILHNKSFGNRTDICNSGTVERFSKNSFKTGGKNTECVVNLLSPAL